MSSSGEQLGAAVTLYAGDCLDVLPTLAENSIDSCVCDPPYGISFMGRSWDHSVPGVPYWCEVYRVLKPGAHLLAFSGTRTYHRMACAIEDAGFEVRDCIQWLYGQGFSKAGYIRDGNGDVIREGWAGSLKPANEPVVLARKPLSEKTVAANVLRWGTGAINVDGCRVGLADGEEPYSYPCGPKGNTFSVAKGADGKRTDPVLGNATGRWPANVIHDGSDEVVAMFPETGPGQIGGVNDPNGAFGYHGGAGGLNTHGIKDAGGSAARFFYSSKADADDRIGSFHPTVKPVDLMQYLCRLVTPPGGTVLDPFAGTGTTGEAAFREGFRAVLIEREAEYQQDIRRRMKLAMAGPVERVCESIKARGKPIDHGPLFGWVQEAAE